VAAFSWAVQAGSRPHLAAGQTPGHSKITDQIQRDTLGHSVGQDQIQ
jgi:hypothetical protein